MLMAPPADPAKSASETATQETADLGDKAIAPEDGDWKHPRKADGDAAAVVEQ